MRATMSILIMWFIIAVISVIEKDTVYTNIKSNKTFILNNASYKCTKVLELTEE